VKTFDDKTVQHVWADFDRLPQISGDPPSKRHRPAKTLDWGLQVVGHIPGFCVWSPFLFSPEDKSPSASLVSSRRF